MTQVALNALWLLVASTTVLTWNAQRRGGKRALRRRKWALVALGCSLVLLLPIISVTDDLREQSAIEDTSTTINKLKSPAGGYGSGHYFMVAALPVVSHSPWHLEGFVPTLTFASVQSLALALGNGRAPPAPLL
jgi:hypothetical protein